MRQWRNQSAALPANRCQPDPCRPLQPGREQDDLTIFGPASFSFRRIYNSRTSLWTDRSWELGTTNTWQHNWQYEMRESSLTSFGFKQIILRYPEGREYYFAASDASGTVFVPQANWGDRLYLIGTNAYVLRTPAGREYSFSRIGPDSNYQYLLNEVRDGKGFSWTLTYLVQSDGKSRLSQITNNFGRSISITRVQSVGNFWRITSIASNDGRTVTYAYSTWTDTSEPFLSSVQYPGGETATYTWAGSLSSTSGPPVLASAVDPMHHGSGSRCRYVYNYTAIYGDSFGSLVKGTILEERNYDTNQLIVSFPTGGDYSPLIVEGNGTTVVRSFSSVVGGNDNLTQVGDGAGRNVFHAYSAGGAGFRTSTTDDAGAVTTYTPDYAGRHTSVADALGHTSYATYNSNGFLLTSTDELGRVTTHTRNSGNQITRTDYPDGTYETFTYTGSGLVSTHRLKNGITETFTYNSSGDLVTVVDAAGYTTTHTYNANGLRATTVDPLSHTTSFQYNWRGQMTRLTHPDATYVQMAYDTYGNLTSRTDELGHVWSRTYTEYNEVKTETDPLSRVTSYEYGQSPGCTSCGYRPTLTRITLPSGKKTEYSYDASGKRISMKTGAGTSDEATTTYAYDAVGNLASSTDPLGHTTTYGYDLLHRKTSETDPLTHTTSFTYDYVGNTLTITRPDSTVTTMTYDSMNRVLTTKNPNNETTTFTYLADGSLGTLKDARNNTYTFTVDGLSRRTRMTYPGGSYENWAYDGAGNQTIYTARSSVTRTFTFDTRNRDTFCDWSDSTPDVTKTYDAASRLLTLNNANSALTYTYNNANELLTEAQAITGGPSTQTVTYTYTVDGNRSTLTYPDTTAVSYTYTNRNQLSGVLGAGSAVIAQYTYNLDGLRTSKTMGNGLIADSVYDAAHRLTQLKHRSGSTNLAIFDYTYNTVNNRTGKTTTQAVGATLGESYSYDNADQLTGTTYTAGGSTTRTAAYAYDAAGNRTSVTDGTVTPYTANNLNQYTGIDSLTSPVWSSNGNLTSVQYPTVDGVSTGSWTYTYDSQNRMLSASGPGNSVTFAYDARNRCVKRVINGTTRYQIFDGWNLLAEHTGGSGSGTPIIRYVHGTTVDEIITGTVISTGTAIYSLHDALGSVIALSSTAGSIVEKVSYDAYGYPSIYTASGTLLSTSAYGNRFLYTGRELVREAALYDYRNRMYSPQLGRFMQTDPIRLGGRDVNLYRYVGNDVISLIDPIGLYSYKVNECEIKLVYGHGGPGYVHDFEMKSPCSRAGFIGCGRKSGNSKIPENQRYPSDELNDDTMTDTQVWEELENAVKGAKKEAQGLCECCKAKGVKLTIEFSEHNTALGRARDSIWSFDAYAKALGGKEQIIKCE